MKKKKKKALKRQEVYKSWRKAWGIRVEDATSLNGLAEAIKSGDLVGIDRSPNPWWKNNAS